MTITERVNKLERKMNRIEGLLWYVAGALSIQFGIKIVPEITQVVMGLR